MALIEARNVATGITLTAPHIEVLAYAETLDVVVWRDTVSAVAAGTTADAWISAALNHDTAPHLRVTNATECRAENLESPGPGRREPEVGDQTWHQIHLGRELGHIKVVYDV